MSAERSKTNKFQARVFGNPIEQSKSPIIHHNFADQVGISLNYERQLSNNESFKEDVESFFAIPEAVGANVTLPFKELAFQIVDEVSEAARLSKAINTISKRDGKLYGDNTDGIGLVSDLTEQGATIKDRKLLLIGAGGAARGVIPSLIAESPASISIQNRTTARAQQIIDDYAQEGISISLYEPDGHYDLLINCTSLSLHNQVPALPISLYRNVEFCYDMVYRKSETAFMAFARANGCDAVSDGLGMLTGQAAESFKIWFNQQPNVTKELKKKLRE